MNNSNVIIEVKTKWIFTNNRYTRKIIEYICNTNEIFNNPDYYTRFLIPIKTYDETCLRIKENIIEINARNQETKELIRKPDKLVKTLLNYTKQQWLYEE